MLANIMLRFLRAFDIPEDALGSVPRITLTGDRRVLIENHRGLLAYEKDHIAVNGGRVMVKLRGDGLELRAMDRSEILVAGQFFSLELE